MIKFVEWVLGRHADDLRAEQVAAEQDVAVSKVLRANAERHGAMARRLLAENHFGERMAAALEPRGWDPR